MPFDPSTAVAEPSGADVKFDASTAVLDEPEPQSNSPMPPERQEPTAQITSEEEPGMLTRARESLSPLIGPTERQRSMGMVPFGKDADGNTIYRYKPLASRIEREGLLTTPLIEAPEPVKGPNPSGALLGSLLLGPSGIGGMLSEEHRTAVGNAVINTLSGIGQANILNLLTTPAALATTLPKTAKAVSAGFALDMARHVPEQVKQAVTAPDLQGKLEGALGAVSGVALATMAGKHAIKSTAAPKGIEIPKVDGVKFNGVDEMGNYQFTDEANGGTFSVKEPTREAVEARRAVKQQEFAEPTATEADIDRILAEQAPKAAPSPGKITTKLSERLRSNDPEVRAKAWDEAKAMQEEEMLASDTPPVPEPIPQEPLAPPSESPLPFKLEETPAPAPVSESAKLDDLMSLIQRPKETPEPAPAEPSPSTIESTAPSAPEARPQEKSEAVSPEKPKPLSAKEKERLNDLNRRLSDLEAERKFAVDEGDQATVDSIGRVEARFRAERDALKERNVSEPQVTGIRNRIVDEERQKRGLPPAMEPARRSFGKVWDEAMRKIEDDPKAGEKLVTELQDKPRPLTDTEDALLTHEQITRQNAFDRAVEDVNSRPEDPSAIRALETARDELQAIYDAGKAAGTQSGRGLAARKLLAQDDYSLARMESTFRAEANQGKPLSAEQAAQIKELHDRIAAAEKKLSEYEAAQSESEAKRTFENLIRETKKGAREAKKTGGTLLDKLKSGHDEALKNIKSRMGRTSAGVDPTVLYDVARIGAYHIANGAIKLAEFTKRVVDEVGEWIRPSIKEVFDQAQKIHEEGQKAFEGATPKPTALEKAQANAAEGKPINPQQVFDLAREKVNAGITELDKVMEAVHADLAPLHEGLTVRDVRDAFSGYGKVRYPSKAEDLTKLRELKNLARLASAIEDAQNKIAPKKTGAQRDKPTQAVRDMMKRLRDEMRKAGIETTSPEQQLASANQARATALRNQIEDLDRQLQTGEKPERPTPAPDTPEVERLRAERDAMKEKLREIEEAENPPPTPDEKRLAADKKRIQKAIDELKRRIAEEDYSKPVRGEPLMDKEKRDLLFEKAKAQQEYSKILFEEKLRNRSTAKKVLGGIAEVFNTSRAVITAIDLSAVFRQGGFVVLGHPVKAARIIPKMLKAMASEKAAFAIDEEIANRPNAPLYKASKLYLAEENNHLPSKMEEAYMSRWAKKIPGVKASERAYTTFLNKLRADTFDSMVEGLVPGGKPTPEEAKAIANYINVATGRGSVGFNQAATGLNTVFFSPRYVASRFQLLAGQPLYGGTARTRKLIAKEYAKFLAGAAVAYGLAVAAGAELETDPRSSDFGKAKFGNTRVDALTGLAQNTVLLSRLATGEKKTLSGKVQPIRGDKIPFGGQSAADVLAQFARSKLSPLVGSSINVLSGRNVIGEPTSLGKEAANLVTPMSLRDIYETMVEQGVPKGTAISILSIFGMSVQTYEDRRK